MRKIFLFLSLMLFVGYSFSQTTVTATRVLNTSDVMVYYFIDTITDTEVLHMTVPGVIPADWTYSVQLVCDSLSGSTAGTVTLNQSNVEAGTDYTITQTQTLDDVNIEKIWESAAGWLGPKMRLISTGSGTMSCKVRVWVYFNKNRNH